MICYHLTFPETKFALRLSLLSLHDLGVGIFWAGLVTLSIASPGYARLWLRWLHPGLAWLRLRQPLCKGAEYSVGLLVPTLEYTSAHHTEADLTSLEG